MISRSDVLNQILQLYPNPRYLEVGVNRGETFFAVKAASKVAVDPCFLFPLDEARKDHTDSEFYSVTSDYYFSTHTKHSDRFDLVYLDGLHTFEQTLRDFTNAIHFLSEDGVIVVDDVVPTSYHASLPDQYEFIQLKQFLKSEDNSWMGDTYKLVFFIESFFPTYKLRTITNNHGQAVIWRARTVSDSFVQYSANDISSLAFSDVVKNEAIFHKLDIKDIIDEISSDRHKLTPVKSK